MQDKANAWVGTQLNPNFDIVKQEAERLRGQAAGRRDALQAAYMAAANANQGMGSQVLQGFQTAASTLGGLSAGATGQVGAAMRADIASQDQALRAVGQAATQTGDPAQQQGVENYVGGYLPAANLAQMGAIAQKGFLGEVADQRMRAVSEPWGQYNETISKLDSQELSDLKDLAMKRPDLVQGVLEKLQANNEKTLGGMLDVEKERADRRQQLAKIQQADETLRFRYQEARAKATTAADKLALDDWYKHQQRKLSAARNAISRTNATTSQGRLGVARKNAETSRMRVENAPKPGAPKFKSVGEVAARFSRRDVPAGKGNRARVIKAMYQQWYRSVPPAQRAELLKAINRFVAALPERTSGAANPFEGGPQGPG